MADERQERALELRQVFQGDADEIIAARGKAQLIHSSGDVDAAGDEVENAVRDVLRRKLPSAYYVGHGKVTDSNWQVGPQSDVVIADNAGAPILFKSRGGVEYFPYEAVYAVGEVKSAYYKSKEYVHKFVQDLKHLREKLHREKTPPGYVSPHFSLGDKFEVISTFPYRNPLFSFMLFVNANDFEPNHLEELYEASPAGEMPTLLCFLDKGVFFRAKPSVAPDGKIHTLETVLYPEFDERAEAGGGRWVFVPSADHEFARGGNFALLYFALAQHLRSSLLMPPDMMTYLRPILFQGISKLIAFGSQPLPPQV